MTPHPCPFTAGQLLAIGALLETRSRTPDAPAGSAALAEACYEHALQHPTTTTEGTDQ